MKTKYRFEGIINSLFKRVCNASIKLVCVPHTQDAGSHIIQYTP